MAERAFIDRVVQLADEVTPGTAETSGFRRLPGLTFRFTPERMVEPIRGSGYKSTTTVVDNGGWATGSYDGPVDFNEIIWPLNGLVGGAITTPGGATNTRRHTFTPAATGRDTAQKTFTCEMGDQDAAQLATFLQFRSWQLDVQRRGLSRQTGSLFSRYPDDGNALTSSGLVTVAQRPVAGTMWDIYADATYAALGTTKVASCYRAGFAVGDKYNPFWVLNTSFPSFKDTVEVAHDITGSFATAHNAASRAFFDLIAGGTQPTYYLRFLATGALIEGSFNEKITLDFAAKFTTPEEDDVDGVYGYNYNVQSVYDASLGGNWRITVDNQITAI